MKEYETIAIEKLRPYENNARTHSEDQIEMIVNSINEFGFVSPCVIDENNMILVGHGRVEAAKRAGLAEVPCRRITHLTEDQKKAYVLADNKLSDLGGWDDNLLQIELQSIDLDMSEFGFELNLDENEPQEIEEDEIPEEVETRCKLGDIWQLGDHRLICGDSTDTAVIDRLMDGVKADMLLTDPPYNVDYTGKTKDALKIQNDKMDNDSFRQFLRDAFASADSVMRAGAVFLHLARRLGRVQFQGGLCG